MPEETQTITSQETTALVPAPAAPRASMRDMLAVLKDTGDPDLFKAFARDIIEREVAAARFGEDGILARVFAGSGAFDGIDGTARGISMAMTKIQMGRSWNMQPADAMEAVFFINGRPSVATRYLAAKIQDAGVAWDIEWDEDANKVCTGCHLHLKRWNPSINRYEPMNEKVNGVEQQAVVSFTQRDADTAIITENGKQKKLSEKWNFVSWRSDMYFARCISRVRNRYVPNVLSGVPTREEAEDAGDSPQRQLPAATASAARTESLGEKLREAKKAVETPAAATAAAVAPTAAVTPATTPAPAPNPTAITSETPSPTAASTPWIDRKSMNGDFLAVKKSIGDIEFKKILDKHGIVMGAADYLDPKVFACYRDMKDPKAEAVSPAPAPVSTAPVAPPDDADALF